MKKRTKVILVILTVVVASCCGVVVWQWDNIRVLHYALNTNAQTIAANEESVEKNLSKTLGTTINGNDVTKKFVDNFSDGNFSLREAAEAAVSQAESSNEEQSGESDHAETQNESTSDSVATQADQDYQKKIDIITAELYVLRGSYSAKLNAIAKEAESEFYALPAKERTQANKEKIAFSKYSQVAAIESKCDAQVKDLVAELREVLSAAGRDSTIADKVENLYQQLKDEQKARLISELKG